MRSIVNGVLVRNNLVLLALRSPSRAAYAAKWSFPGGHVECNETHTGALMRELREEIGVCPTEFEFLQTIPDPNAPRSDSATYYLYAVTNWEGGEPRLIGDEHTRLEWFALANAGRIDGLALSEYQDVFRKLTEC